MKTNTLLVCTAALATAALVSACSTQESKYENLPHAAPNSLPNSARQTSVGLLEFDSYQLMMKNSEQVQALVTERIKRAQKVQSQQEVDYDVGIQSEPEAISLLKAAMKIALSRPDQDGARTNMFSRVRRELQDLNAFDDSIKEVADEAITWLKRSNTGVRTQGTYVILLENMLAEMKPDAKSNETFRKITEQIRDADIKISDKLKNEALLRSMSKPVSPSETAAKILPRSNK